MHAFELAQRTRSGKLHAGSALIAGGRKSKEMRLPNQSAWLVIEWRICIDLESTPRVRRRGLGLGQVGEGRQSGSVRHLVRRLLDGQGGRRIPRRNAVTHLGGRGATHEETPPRQRSRTGKGAEPVGARAKMQAQRPAGCEARWSAFQFLCRLHAAASSLLYESPLCVVPSRAGSSRPLVHRAPSAARSSGPLEAAGESQSTSPDWDSQALARDGAHSGRAKGGSGREAAPDAGRQGGKPLG